MAGYFETRRMVKQAHEWLRHAKHCRHMREDVASGESLARLAKAEADLAAAAAARQVSAISRGCDSVHQAMAAVAPARSHPAIRENLEVLVVAVAVAMAFRAYCLQPFKIPTGSMQPTLYGIHHTPQDGKGLFDQGPLRFLKWTVSGEWYLEVTAQQAGVFREERSQWDRQIHYTVGGVLQEIPSGLKIIVKTGDEVVTGQILATGNRTTGDHLFVNRVKWNFMMPQRGEVMVFRTDGLPIPRLTERTHYIKRMSGLPNETISILPPALLVNGKPVRDPASMRRIADQTPGYAGYTLGEGPDALMLASSLDSLKLGPNQYLALGDNTKNSLDGRYWGPVPATNLVGPAMVVYWPLSERWGWIK